MLFPRLRMTLHVARLIAKGHIKATWTGRVL